MGNWAVHFSMHGIFIHECFWANISFSFMEISFSCIAFSFDDFFMHETFRTDRQQYIFESPLDPQTGWLGRYINVRRWGGLPMFLLQQKDPLELLVFVKSSAFLPGSRFLSRRDMS